MQCDIISDTLTRIRNAYAVKHSVVHVFCSRMTKSIIDVLIQEGYVDGCEEIADPAPVSKRSQYKVLAVRLRYDSQKRPAMRSIQRYSKPSRRLYAGAEDIPQVKRNLGTVVMSTSRGVISGRQAKEWNIGGEVICTVF